MSNTKLRAAILIVSETVSADPSTDKCLPALKEVFDNAGNDQWEIVAAGVAPDTILDIQKFIRKYSDWEDAVNLIITSGGTGFAVKDVTPEVWIWDAVLGDAFANALVGSLAHAEQACPRTCVSTLLSQAELVSSNILTVMACWLRHTRLLHVCAPSVT